MKLKSILTQLSTVALLLMSACVQEKGKIALKYSEQNTYTPPVLLVTLTNTPANPSSNYYPLNVSVGGSLVAQYSYAIISGSQICSLAAYSSFFATSVPITDPVSEGDRKLCVKGRSSDGVVQANATEHAWYQDNTPPSLSLFELRDNSNGSSTGTDSFTVNAVGASSGTPTPLSYCFKTTPGTPTVGDGCWSTNATQGVSVASSTTTIYAWVKDAVQNISSSSSDTIPVLYPVVALTNAPTNPSSSTPLNVTVGGSYMGSYDYVITNQTTSCSVAVFPGTWTSILTPITAVPADGLDRLCVKGRTAGGIDSTSTYQHDWLQDATGPTILSFILRDQTDNSSTGTDSYTVNGIFSATGTPSPLEYCVSTTASTPTPTDGCWTSSTSSSVVIGFATTTVYGWARDAYKNLSSSSTDTIAIAYPVIQATNLPTNPTTSTAMNVDVFGSYVHLYDYSITNQSTDCSSATYGGSWISATTTNITNTVTDGANRLCVKAITLGGVQSTTTYMYDWNVASTLPVMTSFVLRDTSDSSSTATDSFTVNGIFAATSSFTPLSYCLSTTAVNPLSGDSCWSASTTQSVVIASSSTLVYAWAKDSFGNVSASSSDTIFVLYPVIQASGLPNNPATSTALNIDIYGSYVYEYDYSLTNQSTSCGGATYTGSWISATSTNITGNAPEGANRLCVTARTAGGVPSTTTYSYDWLTDTVAPTITSFVLRDLSDNSSTGTDSYTVNAVFSATGTPTPLQYCALTTAATPTPSDGCWTTSTSTSVVIGFSTTTVYGWARDAYQNVSASSSDTITILYPQISLTNAPSSPSTSTPLNVTVGGQYAATYDYALTDQTIDCSSVSFIGPWLSTTSTAITNAPSDGNKRLCVITRTAGGVNSTYTYVHDWVQDSTAPTITLFELRDQSDNSTTLTDSTTVNAVMSATGTPMPLSYCFSTSSATPSAGCWSSSSTQAATIVSSATIIYGWVRDAYGNMASSSDSIPFSNLCDSGTLATTCVVTSTKTLLVGEIIAGSGNLVVSTGGSINATGTTPIGINMGGDITLQNGGSIVGNLYATSTNFTLDHLSSISANGLGYVGGTSTGYIGQGPGGGQGGVGSGAGGGHGGAGGYGNYLNVLGGNSYGSTTTPTTWGSGGGGADVANAPGGAGGGSIRLSISGILSVSGTISANGSNGSIGSSGRSSGGGAGGSIWIVAAGLDSATGTITANGGAGTASTYYGGGGAGGRVALDLAKPFIGMVKVDGGLAGYPYESVSRYGHRGSIFVTYDTICSSGSESGTCTINDIVQLHDGFSASGTGNFIINSGGVLKTFYPDDDFSFTSSGNLTLNGGVIDTKSLLLSATDVSLQSSSTIKANIDLSANNLTLDNTSRLSANGKGFAGGHTYLLPNNTGLGTGGGIGGLGSGGGGHGGAGGYGNYLNSLGGTSYGSTTTPTTWGSGGGGSDVADGVGGAGGGAIRLNLSGTLSTSGTISADGWGGVIGSSGRASGGGAGGSIWISAAGLSVATGTIRAVGGAGIASTYNSGGGGGGRVAMYLPKPYQGTVLVDGGSPGYPYETVSLAGHRGSIYHSYGTICSSGSENTTCTITDVVNLAKGYSASGTGHFIINSTGKLKSYYNNDDFSLITTGNLTLNGGEMDAKSITINVNDMALNSSSTIRGNLALTAVNLTLSSSSMISASGRGYAGGLLYNYSNYNGLGPGAGQGGLGAGGGGHGGAGGAGHYLSYLGGGSYGSTSSPTTWGSGGGGTDVANAYGGAGGGAIRINLSGTLSISGTIAADGWEGMVGTSGRVSGGGAGGSIWISTASMSSATGTLSAKGGAGGASTYYSGGGGGGRIALYLPRPFLGSVALDGGAPGYDYESVTKGGNRGSLFVSYGTICNTGTESTTCTITDVLTLPDGHSVSGSGNFIITGSGKLRSISAADDFSLLAGGNLTLSNGSIEAKSVTLSASTVSVQSSSTIRANVDLTATNFSLDSNSSVNADGKGHPGGNVKLINAQTGSGSGGGAGNQAGGGGGHGGSGGSGNSGSAAGGGTYGSNTNPTSWGSGGGGTDSTAESGGSGGGAIKLSLSGQFSSSGTISANGNPGLVAGNRATGGGSGGSIWIIASTLGSSTGTISANGGNGINSAYYSGGGGGGRIALDFNSPYYGTVTVSGGTSGYYDQSIAQNGSVGTIYVTYDNVCTSGTESGTCTITKVVKLHNGYSINNTGNFIIDSGGKLTTFNATDAFTLTTTGNLTLQNGGEINANVEVNANHINVGSGSKIDANAKGYAGGAPTQASALGTGAGLNAAAGAVAGGGGAGYGGRGGAGESLANSGGTTYGSILAPTSLGSGGGGGGSYLSVGGNGGGKIKLTTSGNLSVTGTISANGGDGVVDATRGGGGGSGGSVWIMVDGHLYGTGLITANGGNGAATTYDGGGGGGGRIALEYVSRNFIGSHTTNIGSGNTGGTNGRAGSVCLNKSGPLCGEGLNDSIGLWLSADTGISKDGSNNITAWKDQSGLANNIASITSDPNWNIANYELNSKPVISFDGNDAMSISSVSLSEFTIFMVTDITTAGNIYEHSSDSTTNNGSYVYATTGNTTHVRRSGQVSSQQYYNNWNADGVARMVTHVYGGTHARNDLVVNGEYKKLTDASAGSVDSSTTTAEFNIASRNESSRFVTGDIAELIAYNRALTISERQQVEGYLAAKYGLSVATSTNMLGWYKADKGAYTNLGCTTSSTITNDDVNCWRDQSGKNNHVYASGIPGYKTNGINKLPSVNYDGTNLLYSLAASGTAQNLFVVAQRTTDATPSVVEYLASHYKDTASYFLNAMSVAGEFNSLKASTSTVASYLASSGLLAETTTPFLLDSTISNKSVHRMLYNGEQLGYVVSDGGLTHTSGTFSLGYDFDGDLGEVIITQNDLTEYQRTGIESYLAAKYGVPYATHPAFDTNNIVGWWTADAGVTTNDKAAEFVSANNEYLNIADNAALSTGNIDFSIAVWVYLDSKSGNMRLFNKKTTAVNQREYDIQYLSATDSFDFGVSTDGTSGNQFGVGTENDIASISTGRWYFIVAWHDATANTINIEIDGSILESQSHSGGVFDSTTAVSIGRYDGATANLNGRVAKAGFWKRVLTNAERLQLYNKGKGINYNGLSSGLKTNLISYWNLDEASGTRNDSHSTNHFTDNNTVTQNNFSSGSRVSTWEDQSGRGNNASSTISANLPAWIADGGSTFNNRPVLRFDGVDDYIPTKSFDIGSNHTVFAVAKINGSFGGTYHSIALHGASYGSSGNFFHLYANGTNEMRLNYATDTLDVTGPNISAGPHIISTVKNNTSSVSSLYSDGLLVGTGTGTQAQGTYPLFIGSWNNNDFNGDLAELIIFSGDLSTSERQAIECYLGEKYNVTLGISCP